MDDLLDALLALLWLKRDTDAASQREAARQSKVEQAKNRQSPRAWEAVVEEWLSR